MKKIVLLLTLNFYVILSFGQLNMFGIDVSKHISYESDVSYKKIACASNPFFTIAEYKDMVGMKFILFGNYTAKVETPQMKNPEKYLLELKNIVSKSFGQNITLFYDSALTSRNKENFLWVKKYRDKYLVGTLEYSKFSKRNDFRIIIYKTKIDLQKGLDHILDGIYGWSYSYYDRKIIENI